MTHRRRWGEGALVLLFLGGVISGIATAGEAQTAGSNPAPLTLINNGPATSMTTAHSWQVAILVQTSGDECVTSLRYSAVFAPGATTQRAQGANPDLSNCDQPSTAVTPVTVSFANKIPQGQTAATLLLTYESLPTSSAGVPVQVLATSTVTPHITSIQLNIQISPDRRVEIVLPLILGLALSGVTVLLIWAFFTEEKNNLVAHKLLFASGTWSFKDSWATNIIAVGTLLGALAGGSGVATTLLPGIQVARFTFFLALLGGVVVLVPLIFFVINNINLTSLDEANKKALKDTLPSDDKVVATLKAVLVGAFITLAATYAQLAVSGVLVEESAALPVEKVSLFVLLGGATLVIGFYAAKTTHDLVQSSQESLKSTEDSALAPRTSMNPPNAKSFIL